MTDAPRGVPAPLLLHEMAFSLGVTAALVAAVELKVPDALGDRPAGAAELADRVGADPESLEQLLRALAARGVFQAREDGRYAHTPASRLLREDAPGSRRTMVLLAGAPFAWQIWSRLTDAVRTGTGVCEDLYGTDLFTHLEKNDPELGALFDRAMSRSGEATMRPVVEALDLPRAATVADVGGGHGTLLSMLLDRHPGVRGVLFDLPRVVEGADERLVRGDLSGRCRVVGGDCRRAVPVEADVYVLKNVVHMWDDATAAGVLRTLVRAAPAGARIVLVEQVLDATATPGSATVMDLLMLASQGGRERTAAGFARLLARAGLPAPRITPAGPAAFLVETAVPGAGVSAAAPG
ncbi:methyltransferase [Streptomyces sp. NPDC006193]|uniref:methyltransferase n=1 Tax=Streptomyces sp. NPDC006193 TaxID=3155717 RepID=UPI00339F5357